MKLLRNPVLDNDTTDLKKKKNDRLNEVKAEMKRKPLELAKRKELIVAHYS